MSERDGVGEAKIAPDADQVKENTSREKRDALFEWEDDGGARRTDVGGQLGATRAPGERRRSEQQGRARKKAFSPATGSLRRATVGHLFWRFCPGGQRPH
jgi:hypothetical protein